MGRECPQLLDWHIIDGMITGLVLFSYGFVFKLHACVTVSLTDYGLQFLLCFDMGTVYGYLPL